MKEKQLLTNTEWEVCECLWEDSPLTMTQIAARLTERTGWTKSTGETLVRRMADKGLLRWEQGTKAKLYFPTVAREDRWSRRPGASCAKSSGAAWGCW